MKIPLARPLLIALVLFVLTAWAGLSARKEDSPRRSVAASKLAPRR